MPDPGSRIPDDFAAMREVVQRRYRAVLEAGGPFPDLILIDGGKGQLSAAYEALERIGLANLVAVGIAKKEELLFTRDQMEPDRARRARPCAAAPSAHSRRGASIRGDVPSQGPIDARSAIGARRDSRHRPSSSSRAADEVRQPRWCAPRDARRTRAGVSGRTRRARSSTTSPRRAGNEPRTPNPEPRTL